MGPLEVTLICLATGVVLRVVWKVKGQAQHHCRIRKSAV
jgi:hypothetical protein